jgi:hypothetical protein
MILYLHTVAGAASALVFCDNLTDFPFNQQVLMSCRNQKASGDYKDLGW